MMVSRNADGDIKIFGFTLEQWVTTINVVVGKVGLPLAIVIFLLCLGWRQIPRVVDGHVELLQKTGSTLESMDQTLKQSNAILTEVNQTEQETKQFMHKVIEDHDKHDKKLEIVIEQTKPKPAG
jgi:hypothetical protein